MDPALVSWLITAGLGPALVAIPVNWSAGRLGKSAEGWLARIRHEDGLSRLIAAADPPVQLTRRQLSAVRHLLEDHQTWRLVDGGRVEDLAIAISNCLPINRSTESRLAAGRAVARAVMESAVADLEPDLYQHVLMARIARMETGQASRLDEVTLQLQAGMAAWFAYREQADERRMNRILAQLGLVLNRLPSVPAERVEVCVYLAALIAWLNADPWPMDPRLDGPTLTPALIERKLAMEVRHELGKEADADALIDQSIRLVILGAPGSGKTWLAKRAARRCAETALQALTIGDKELDQVELPIFTTCSLLATKAGGIREAVVSSALDQLGDLGGSRITQAMHVFFAERNDPTLLVIDSLDEARDPGIRLRQVGTLPWRIILTSRPSSWKQQLPVDTADPSQVVGKLIPLHYPSDVNDFISQWFVSDPAKGGALISQIQSRADLQQAATVPLILTFYCIIGGQALLPGTRHEVYRQVIAQLLSGLWRGDGDENTDPAVRASQLRAWAWIGAAKDERTGIGAWSDEIRTPYAQMAPTDRAAVDHVAVPVQQPDLATGASVRRFIHRSIREHLTAEFIATQMSAEQAASELLNHLWYDPDWEYTAPAALAMHPERDLVLRELTARASLSGKLDVAAFDGGGEFRRFLVRVAAESSEDSWARAEATIIGRARLETVASDPLRLPVIPGWPRNDKEVRNQILNQMEAAIPWKADKVIEILERLAPGQGDLTRARRCVLSWLDEHWYPIAELAGSLNRLKAEAADLTRARKRVLDRLETQDNELVVTDGVYALSVLSPEPGDLTRAFNRVLDLMQGFHQLLDVARILRHLAPGPSELKSARGVLLSRLDTDAQALAGGWAVGDLIRALTELEPEPDELARARCRILQVLDEVDEVGTAGTLADMLRTLKPEAEDLSRARDRILDLLDRDDNAWIAGDLARYLNRLGPGAAELRRARRQVLHLLAVVAPGNASARVRALKELEPEPSDLARARGRVLDLIHTADYAYDIQQLTATLSELTPEPSDQIRVRRRILDLLTQSERGEDASQLVTGMLGMEPGPNELAEMRVRILAMLEKSGHLWEASRLADSLTRLAPRPADLTRARGHLLNLFATSDLGEPQVVMEALAQLTPEPDDLSRACARILDLLDAIGVEQIEDLHKLLRALAMVGARSSDLARARALTLQLLDCASPDDAERVIRELTRLEPSVGDLAQARRRVLYLLENHEASRPADLIRALSTLSPVADDLERWTCWAAQPDTNLLGAVRHNSSLSSWLDLLASMKSLSISE